MSQRKRNKIPLKRTPMWDAISKRFFEKIIKTDTCWNWAGAKYKGYGRFIFQNVSVMPHRWSYEFHVGGLRTDLTIDHICRNRACVNPDHLRQISSRENVLIGISPVAINYRKKFCKMGHELAGDNLALVKNKYRVCKICRNKRDAKARINFKPKRKAQYELSKLKKLEALDAKGERE